MAFETSPFGNGVSTANDGNVSANVSNHYGPRGTGGEKGRVKTEGGGNEAVVNFDLDGPLYDITVIPAGAIVTDIRGYDLTGAIATATVGSEDISGASDDDSTTWVEIVDAGELEVTGPTGGRVVVKYRNYA